MTAKKKKAVVAAAVILLLLVVDQLIKIWVKTHMTLGEQIVIAVVPHRVYREQGHGVGHGARLQALPVAVQDSGRDSTVWYIQSQIRKNCGWGFLVMLCMICARRSGQHLRLGVLRTNLLAVDTVRRGAPRVLGTGL